jgi:hypothetical protein
MMRSRSRFSKGSGSAGTLRCHFSWANGFAWTWSVRSIASITIARSDPRTFLTVFGFSPSATVPLCYTIDGTPAPGCQTPTPTRIPVEITTGTPSILCYEISGSPCPTATPTLAWMSSHSVPAVVTG